MSEICSDKTILSLYDTISSDLGDWTDSKGRSMVGEVYSNANDFIRIMNELREYESFANQLTFLCSEAMQIGG